jgi:hypothetical protein
MARRRGWRFVKSRQSYTIDELARNQKVSKGTVRRWRKDGLACLTDQRPHLFIGADVIDYLKSKKSPKRKCAADEFFCFACKEPRRPAFGAIESVQTKAGRHRLRALCCECATVMHKAASQAIVDTLKANPDVSLELASETLSTVAEPR